MVAALFLLLVLLLVAGWEVFCLADLLRAERVRGPRWAWAIACLIQIPLGGILYLLIGRVRGSGHRSEIIGSRRGGSPVA